MVEALLAIAQEIGNVRLSTTDISHRVIDHMLLMAEQHETAQDIAVPTGENNLFVVDSGETRHSHAEFICVTDEGR